MRMSRAPGLRRGASAAAADVSAQADRRFRRSESRPGRRTWKKLAWRAGFLGAGVLVLLVLGAVAVAILLRSPMLAVSQIAIQGNVRLSPAEVEALLDGLKGQNVLRVDFTEYRKRLMDSPWVAGVTLSRVLPGTVVVRIAERVPMAIARLGQQLYLVDDQGVIVDEFGPEYRDVDLPIVDGLVRSPKSGGSVVDEAGVRVTGRFLGALGGRPELRRRVSQIDVSDPRDLIVLLDDDPVLLHVGDTRFVERLTTYLSVASRLHDQVNDIDSADLRLDDVERIYVRAKAKPTPGVGFSNRE